MRPEAERRTGEGWRSSWRDHIRVEKEGPRETRIKDGKAMRGIGDA